MGRLLRSHTQKSFCGISSFETIVVSIVVVVVVDVDVGPSKQIKTNESS